MQTNKRTESDLRTHEGGRAKGIKPEDALKRSVMACMLWEGTFYESGEEIGERIISLSSRVSPEFLANLAVEARTKMNLRHVSLFLVLALFEHPKRLPSLADVVVKVIQRPDEISELLALYWRDGKKPIPAQMKKGFARAFLKFNEYSLAKYNGKKDIRLRDVLFLSRAKPKTPQQAELFEKLANNKLETPDTWEVSLSVGKDKKETFTRLLMERNLGSLALLRNLRNMEASGVSRDLIRQAITEMDTSKVLPFRFIAAAKYAPYFEPELEQALLNSVREKKTFSGRTLVLVDVSGSMDAALSAKSDMTRLNAATGLAVILREMGAACDIYSFSENTFSVPARRGFALAEAISNSQPHSSTYLGRALTSLERHYRGTSLERFVVITDEQSHDNITVYPKAKFGYIINVATNKNGVGYGRNILHLDGFSEAILNYVAAYEEAAED